MLVMFSNEVSFAAGLLIEAEHLDDCYAFKITIANASLLFHNCYAL